MRALRTGRKRAGAPAVVLAAAVLLGGAAPASATSTGDDIGDHGGGGGPLNGLVSGRSYGQAGGCGYVASAGYIGGVCGNGTRDTRSPKDILGKDPVPTCWHEGLTDEEVAALGRHEEIAAPGPQPDWFWEYCLKSGVDPKTKKWDGPVVITVSLVRLPGQDAVHLTPRQRELVDLSSNSSTVPVPVAVTSPTSTPRVGAWTSFYDFGLDPAGDAGDAGTVPGVDRVTVPLSSAVVLEAHVVRTRVQPLGDGRGDDITCEGTGYRAEPGDTPDTADGCWYRYPLSSAGQSDVNKQGLPAYPVVITATWQVDVTVGGVTRRFNTFNKSSTSLVPVSEIQTLVVN